MVVEAPQTVEGEQVWDLAMHCGGQVRAVPGQVIGYDMTAVMAMGQAMGVPPMATAVLMPHIERALTAALNERSSEGAQS